MWITVKRTEYWLMLIIRMIKVIIRIKVEEVIINNTHDKV